MSKKQWEALAAAGAFDSATNNRAAAYAAADVLLKYAGSVRADALSGQGNLFGDEISLTPPPVPDVKAWAPLEALQHEFDAIGFYLSAHPLDSFARALSRLNVVRFAELGDTLTRARSSRVKLAGVVMSVQIKTAKSGNRFAFVQLSDASGVYECMAFAETLLRHRDILAAGQTLLLSVDAQANEDGFRLTIQDVQTLANLAADTADGLLISVQSDKALPALRAAVAKFPVGKSEIYLAMFLPGGARTDVLLPGKFRILSDQRQSISTIPGIAAVEEI
jgi:DNA polymerase-3 subunit alpha